MWEKPGRVARVCNPSPVEAEEEESLGLPGQPTQPTGCIPGHSETLLKEKVGGT